MNRKSEIFEQVLTSPFDNDTFVGFVKEFLNNIQLVAPTNYNKEYSNFSFYVDGYYHIGNYTSDDKDKIAIFSVCLKKGDTVERARGMQRNFVKTLIERGGCVAAIVAFFTEEDATKWRLSFIRMDYEFSKGKITEKLTPAKRYSYLVGKGEPCHTAKQRLYPIFMEDNANPGIDDLEEAFSVEKVTNEFFNLYKEKYIELKEYLESNEDFMNEAAYRNFTSEQFAKKLMGQIVFLYFIQKKGWLGVEAIPVTLTEKQYKKAFFAKGTKSREIVPKIYAQQADGTYHIVLKEFQALSDEDEEILAGIVMGKPWGTGPKNFMRKIFEGCIEAGKNYFDDYLEPLFYTGLNKNRGENGFYAPLHRRIPFLNGGLFEQLDNYEWENNNFNIPNELFSNAATKGRYADGILDIFDRYNFTMNEDEPMEREVAIDPEMLGKVFENLLDVKDRKSKGAFYTPREIVHYMCQEALINHLVTKTELPEEDIRDFVLYGDLMKDEDTTKSAREGNKEMLISPKIFDLSNGTNRLKELDDILANVKIADLAVGSGAFPLGMLSEIVKARETLSAYMSIGMNNFQKKSFYAYDRQPYALKVNTIKNCIFACDIEPSAVDIAKLRLWLSIVIDDEIAESAGNGEFNEHTKPRQLPNLDCNIICGNSLIDEFEGFPERDNENKRVFKSAKMSVCILGSTKTHVKEDVLFPMRISDDRFVDVNSAKTMMSRKDIESIDGKSFTIPIMKPEEYKILLKICEGSTRMAQYSKCYTGEIDLSLNKKYIHFEDTYSRMLRGAQVQKFYTTDNISQGDILFLDSELYLHENSTPRSKHHNEQRIVMQGITGVNERYRLKMTLSNAGEYCANSVNYLMCGQDNFYFLGLLNSHLLNWYFAKLSTNSNVNGYEVDNIPIKIDETKKKYISELVERLLENPTDYESEDELNTLIYDMYGLSKDERKIVERRYL